MLEETGAGRVPLITQIEKAVADIPGWTPLDQLYTLFLLAYAGCSMPGDLLEIGSWCGRSATVLGMAARLCGGTRLVCIDLFPEKADWKENADGSYSFAVNLGNRTYHGYQEQVVWKEAFEDHHARVYERHHSILDIFNENIAKHGLQDIVEARRGDSDLLQGIEGQPFRFAFIDADHSYEAVCKDIRNVDAVLAEGGWICLDDAFSCYEGVDRAVTELLIKNPAYELSRQMTRKLFVARKKRR